MSNMLNVISFIFICGLVVLCSSRSLLPKLEEQSLKIINGHIATSPVTKSIVKLTIEKWNATEKKWSLKRCGGTLISENYVLTAAHCLHDTRDINVTLGTRILPKGSPGVQIIQAKKKNIHENYAPVTLENDIGTIELLVPANITAWVKTVKLPKLANVNQTYAGNLTKAFGWGRTGDNEDQSQVLMAVQVPVIDPTECKKQYPDLPNLDLCISTTSDPKKITGTCRGDSGGPLFYKRTQIAINSFTYGDLCESGEAQAFVRINNYFDWIEKHSDVKFK